MFLCLSLQTMQDLKGVCSPHLVLILYSPSWLVLVLSPFMSLTQFHPSFCPVFGSWGCGSYHRAGHRTIMNYWFRHWNQINNMFGWFRGHHFCRSPTYFRQPDIFAGLFSSVGRSSTHSSVGGVELGVQEFLVTAAVKHGKTPVVLGNKEPFHLNLMSFNYNSSTSKYRMIPAVDSHNFYSDMTVGIRWPQASQHTGRLAAPWESKAVKCRVGTTLMGSVYNARLIMVYDPR